MEATFWHQRWHSGDIGFHEGEVNALLSAHIEKLGLAEGSRIFLPLCGKTRDIAWLRAAGYRVAGVELSEMAVKELFNELGLVPEISRLGPLPLYQAKDIDIFVGDIFALSAESLGVIDAVYDRAALVALPADMRARYSAQLLRICNAAPQLLITFEYNQQLMDGPPFSISEEELKRHYTTSYQLTWVESREVIGGVKGKVAAKETLWLLKQIRK